MAKAGKRQRSSTTEQAASQIDRALRGLGSPERAQQEKRYLKSDLQHYGATVPAMRRVVKEFLRDHPALSRHSLLALVQELWRMPVHERRAAAIELLEQRLDDLGPRDLPLVERLLRQCRGWALLDNLAASVAGPLIERHPQAAGRLDRWAADDDFWMRRASLLALLIPLREGRGDFERFGRYADSLLENREIFIRKAIGWVLRDTSKKRPQLVSEWIEARAARASGLTVREAVRRLPERDRTRILGKLRR